MASPSDDNVEEMVSVGEWQWVKVTSDSEAYLNEDGVPGKVAEIHASSAAVPLTLDDVRLLRDAFDDIIQNSNEVLADGTERLFDADGTIRYECDECGVVASEDETFWDDDGHYCCECFQEKPQLRVVTTEDDEQMQPE